MVWFGRSLNSGLYINGKKVCLEIQGRHVVVSRTIIGLALTQRLIPQLDPHTFQTVASKVHVVLLPDEEAISVDADNL